MRNVHLYLGVFFAPLLIFFVVSGCWQTFDLNQARPEMVGKFQNQNAKPVMTDEDWKNFKAYCR